ncbi:MAG TPA: DinB family protein, partial [Planctomycetota bacterium]|nr:DinB family protein [Planctomycetota bacterium]
MTDGEAGVLLQELRDARSRTLALVQDLQGGQWIGPELPIVNPPLWEIGHVAWFQEQWLLRHALARERLRPGVDELYDSAAIDHWDRWAVRLPTVADTLQYMQQVLDAVADALAARHRDNELAYYLRLATYHEDMHGEALCYTRQTLGYPAPQLGRPAPAAPAGGPLPGDAVIPGGTFWLGSPRTAAFVFDNEKWAHPVEVATFRLARAPVTEAEFAGFVDDGGYARRPLWSDDGWDW